MSGSIDALVEQSRGWRRGAIMALTEQHAGRFAQRVAIVTGSGQGIGRAIAERLARDGARVVVADVHTEQARAAAAALRVEGLQAVDAVLDVTDPASVRDMVEHALRAYGGVDILVNNAGVLRSTAVEAISPEEWDLVLDVNLKGAFLCAQAVLGTMVSRGGGRIVNMASMAGRATSTLGGAHYTAAKAGLLGLSRHLAREWAPHRITVNAVCPGIVDTPMVRHAVDAERMARVLASIPFGRLAEPSEIAGLVSFLASDEAAYITGASVDIHGGEMIIQ
jgi:NAD(P)-dependent dehydrogenase (short-subunit alcohol dehydrogenase family)